MDDRRALSAFSALSNETRLNIVKRLVEAGPTGMPAGDVALSVGASPSRASFHLATLSDAGLVTADRQAREIRYSVSFATLGALMNFVLNDCCKGEPSVRSCCGLR